MARATAVQSQGNSHNQKLDTILGKLEGLSKPGTGPALEWSKVAIPSAIAIATIAVGFAQYISTSSLSVRQPFLEKQTALCLSASEHIARLATTRDKEQWQKSAAEFWMLYYGPLAVVEEAGTESQVANMMVQAGKVLQKSDPEPKQLPVEDLQGPALEVAHACRDLLSKKWRTGILAWLGYR